MDSPQQQATMDDLPGDVLSNILTRLLARELVQLKCVSKSWNALLSESSFIKSHFHHSIHKKDAILLVFTKENFSFDHEPFTAHHSQSPDLRLTDFIKIPVNSESKYTVIGSVNGLICLSHASYDSYVISIWNPSLSAMLNLSPYATHAHGYNNDHSIKIFFRFGFDPKADDYKVVKLAGIVQQHSITLNNGLVIKDWLQVEVYSMRKGTWEIINQMFPSHVSSIALQHEVCTDGRNGHLHWLANIQENMMEQTIVAFDLGLETFSEISFPNSKQDDSVQRRYVLGVFRGKLCVMSDDGYRCDVWLMREYGVAESWIKYHVLSHYGIIPYGFTSHNQFIFDGIFKIDFVLYDWITTTEKGIRCISTRRGNTKIIEYVDSLVWIVPPQREISSHFPISKKGINNGLRATKPNAFYLLMLFFLVIAFMMIFFLISIMSSTTR